MYASSDSSQEFGMFFMVHIKTKPCIVSMIHMVDSHHALSNYRVKNISASKIATQKHNWSATYPVVIRMPKIHKTLLIHKLHAIIH